MREILFRGKRIDNGEWVKGSFWDEIPGELGGIAQYGSCVFHHVDLATVGQFTGLTTHGTKIFEGDIVRVERDLYSGENKKERETFNGVVWYDEKHTCFGLKSKKYRCLPIHRFKGDYSTVIGNVHDHPELLEVER